MLLITETNFNEIEVLNETNSNGEKVLYIEGIFAQAEKKNRNGRIYPTPILEREVLKFDEDMIKTNRALGELEHPSNPIINPDRVSHRIVEMRRDGNDFIGKARILDTPCGNIVKGIVEGGSTLGVSTRGMGSVSNVKGNTMINEDFNLVTVDVVTNPSGIDCWVNGIMEGVEWKLDESGNFKQVERQQVFEKAKEMLSEKQRLSKILKFIESI